jgi:putative ABC transport system permease protein
MVRDYFYTLKTPETVTAFEYDYTQKYRQSVVRREGDKDMRKVNMRFIDNAFWRVFEFDFVQGTPFTQEEFESGVRRAVITQSIARKLFKSENPIGLSMQIDNISYTVCGVVKDVSPVFQFAYGDVFAPYTSKQEYNSSQVFKAKWVMMYLVVILAKDPKDYPLIAEEVLSQERKYATKTNLPHIMRFGAPYEHAHFDATSAHCNAWNSLDVQKSERLTGTIQTVFLFLVLLLVPALNLSGFSVSRMKKRREEIGIRKAFGARTSTVLLQVLYESIITSFIGGVIGLVLSYIAILLMKGWILGVAAGAAVPISVLVSPSIFLLVALFCVLLSVMSSGIPALRAARMNIVKSISKNDK